MPDDDRGAQHGDGDAVAAQQVLDLAARAQVRGQVLVLAAQAAEVDDAPDAGLRGRGAEVLRRLRVGRLEVLAVEGVDEVVGRVRAVEGRAEAVGLGDVAVDGVAGALVRVGVPGHRPDVVAGLDQRLAQVGPHEAGGPGDRDGQRHVVLLQLVVVPRAPASGTRAGVWGSPPT